MKVKQYNAPDMRQALRLISESLGPDAVILSNRRVDDGVEVVAALDYDETALNDAIQQYHEIQEDVLDDELALATPKISNAQTVDETTLNNMKEEMASLRNILENDLAGLAWTVQKDRSPLQSALIQKLFALGIPPVLGKTFITNIGEETAVSKAWSTVLQQVKASLLLYTEREHHPNVLAFFGASGVGKTTTIAKLTTQALKRYAADEVLILTTDNIRIGAFAHWQIYAKLLGVQVKLIESKERLKSTIQQYQSKRLILIDTPGLSRRDPQLSSQLSIFESPSTRIEKFVVIPANQQTTALEETLKTFSSLSLDACVLSKLDETQRVGEILSVVIKHQLPIAYVCNGPNAAQDIQSPNPEYLVDDLLNQSTLETIGCDEESIAYAFAGGEIS